MSWRGRYDSWLVEDDDGRPWARFQDRRAQNAVTSSHVDNGCALGEVIRGDNRDGILLCHVALVLVEDDRRILRGVEIAEERLPVDMVESGFACSDAVEEFSTCPPPPGCSVEHGRSSKRAGHIASQGLSKRRHCEYPRIGLCEDAETGECTQNPVQGFGIDVSCDGQVSAASRPAA